MSAPVPPRHLGQVFTSPVCHWYIVIKNTQTVTEVIIDHNGLPRRSRCVSGPVMLPPMILLHIITERRRKAQCFGAAIPRVKRTEVELN